MYPAYCIIIEGLELSEKLGARCIGSAAEVGFAVEEFGATPRHAAGSAAGELGLSGRSSSSDTPGWEGGRRRLRDTQLGCFVSHFRLWLKCIEHGVPLTVLEHDAIIRARPGPARFRHVLNIQSSYWKDPEWKFYGSVSAERRDPEVAWHGPGATGVLPAEFYCLPNSSAYMVTPEGAELLVKKARGEGLAPLDLFVNKGVVEIADLVPFPAVSLWEPGKSTVAPRARWVGYDGGRGTGGAQ